MEDVRLQQDETTPPTCKTPPPRGQEIDPGTQISGKDFKKYSSPDPLKLPKPFKYPERYRSPTDMMVSPVTRGILARGRKSSALLPPSLNQPIKVQDMQVQEVISFKIET